MRKPRPRANAIDGHVGSRVRTRRTLLGLNQTQLGNALGIAFQQVQKYERGSNRIATSRLYQISKILDVPIGYFYEEMPDELRRLAPSMNRSARESVPNDSDLDTMHKRETLELVRAYYRIEDAGVRDRLRDMVRAIAGEKRRGRPPGISG